MSCRALCKGIQIEDVAADIHDHVVQVGHDLAQARVDELWFTVDALPAIFEHETHGIDRLNDTVVQFAAKALAFLQNCQLSRSGYRDNRFR